MTSASDKAARTGRRRRILVCTPFAPRRDARHGGKATAQLLLRLAERNRIALLSLRAPGEEPVDPAIADRCERVTEIPRPAITERARQTNWAFGMLRGLPPWATDCRSADYRSALSQLLDDWQPDVVEIHLQAMAQYVDAAVLRGVPRVLVDYDPASAWADELRTTTHGPRRLVRRLEVAAWRRYERATRPRFNAIVVFADRDVAAVKPTAGSALVRRIPLAVELPARPLDPEGAAPPTVLFVGSFGHPPNVDAAIWLADAIFPRVAERVPEARLELVGHEPGPGIRAREHGAVSVHGSVPDVTPYLNRAAVVVAPIRIGGSMRMKVLETLAAGKALVATSRATEGVEAIAGEHFQLADTEHEIVDALSALLLDPDLRRAHGENARAWAEQHLGWDAGVTAFEQLYDQLALEQTANASAHAHRRVHG